MRDTDFGKYCISTLGGTGSVWLAILIVGSIAVPDFILVAMIMLVFVLPTSIAACVVGYPVFKTCIKKTAGLNFYFSVLASGLASSVAPLGLAALAIMLAFPSGGGVSAYWSSLLSVILVGLPFVVVSSAIYWLLAKAPSK